MGLYKSAAWKILLFYLEKPSTEAYVKQLSRQLRLGPGTVSSVCRRLHQEGLLLPQKRGNVLFYSLDNSSPYVKRLKSAWFLGKLVRFRELYSNPEYQSVALFGSYASGEYVEKSDIDVLVVTNVPASSVESALSSLGAKLKAPLSVTTLTLARWRELAKHKDRFFIEVLSNHILLRGASIVI
jgi:hypothetical protein